MFVDNIKENNSILIVVTPLYNISFLKIRNVIQESKLTTGLYSGPSGN